MQTTRSRILRGRQYAQLGQMSIAAHTAKDFRPYLLAFQAAGPWSPLKPYPHALWRERRNPCKRWLSDPYVINQAKSLKTQLPARRAGWVLDRSRRRDVPLLRVAPSVPSNFTRLRSGRVIDMLRAALFHHDKIFQQCNRWSEKLQVTGQPFGVRQNEEMPKLAAAVLIGVEASGPELL